MSNKPASNSVPKQGALRPMPRLNIEDPHKASILPAIPEYLGYVLTAVVIWLGYTLFVVVTDFVETAVISGEEVIEGVRKKNITIPTIPTVGLDSFGKTDGLFSNGREQKIIDQSSSSIQKFFSRVRRSFLELRPKVSRFFTSVKRSVTNSVLGA